MTNIIAAIIITISTNWTSIGTFTPNNSYGTENVLQGRIVTNTTAIMQWRGVEHRYVLQSDEGPVVGERREPKTHWWTTNWVIPGNIYITNLSDGFPVEALRVPTITTNLHQ